MKSVSDAVTRQMMALAIAARDALSSKTIKRNAENVKETFATIMLGYMVLPRTNAVVYLSASNAEEEKKSVSMKDATNTKDVACVGYTRKRGTNPNS